MNYSLVPLKMMAMSNRADRLPHRVRLLLRQAQMVAPSSFVFNLRIAQVLIEVRPRFEPSPFAPAQSQAHDRRQ